MSENGHRLTQRDRLLRLLAEAQGAEVSLLDILALRISQYNSRILDLRAEGHIIINRVEVKSGVKHSFYRLVPKAGQQELFHKIAS
jgi:hypothetical protein